MVSGYRLAISQSGLGHRLLYPDAQFKVASGTLAWYAVSYAEQPLDDTSV